MAEAISAPSYGDFVEFRSLSNPCITSLLEHIMHTSSRSSSSVIVLDLPGNGRGHSGSRVIPEYELPSILASHPSSGGRVIIVEDLQPHLISLLGKLFDLDPIFFAGHVSTEFQDIENNPPPPSLALFPSQIANRGFLHVHYQQVIHLPDGFGASTAYSFKTTSNFPRSVRRLPLLSGQQLALARRCCSVMLKRFDTAWICLILTDPPVSSITEFPKSGGARIYPTQPLHGVFEEFAQPVPFSSFSPHRGKFARSSMAERLTGYLLAHNSGLAGPITSILSIGYYPIRIALAEWALYTLVVSRFNKYYEYSLRNVHERLHDSDIVDLQRWRRRCIQSRNKLYILAEFATYWLQHEADKQPWEMVLKDIDHVSSQLKEYGHSLEQMIQVATSMVQLLDSRSSLAQAANITRLTYIALVFVPLSWMASLFSMGDGYSPGQDRFWVYFAASVPLLIVVLLASALPAGGRKLMQTMYGTWERCKRWLSVRTGAFS